MTISRYAHCQNSDLLWLPKAAFDAWVAQDVVRFASISDKKMFNKVIVEASLQWYCGDINFRILMPNLFYFDLGYIFRDLCKHLVNDVSHPCLLWVQQCYCERKAKIFWRDTMESAYRFTNTQSIPDEDQGARIRRAYLLLRGRIRQLNNWHPIPEQPQKLQIIKI